MNAVADRPMFKPYFADADYADEKSITAEVTLREFIAGMLCYYPWWVVLLYRVRQVLVVLLGLVRHEKPETLPNLKPGDIPFEPGEKASFFIVTRAEEERHWIAETPADNHLDAYFGIVAQPLGGGRHRFTVFTTVRYHHWSGPVYFNLIRPFHHLVVMQMMKSGARPKVIANGGTSKRCAGDGLIDRFSPFERVLLPAGWYGFMLVAVWGIFGQSPAGAVFYLLYSLMVFGLVILPGLCAHCPYPSRYGTCLFLPPGLLNRFFPYRGPRMSAAAKLGVPAAMAGVVLLPQWWLIRDLTTLMLFWLLALPTLAAFPRHYCRRCRHADCPLNRAKIGKTVCE